MWKFSYLFVSIVFFAFSASGQNTETDHSEAGEGEWDFIRTHRSEIFRFRDTTRWMIRWDVAAMASPLIVSEPLVGDLDVTIEFLPIRNWSIAAFTQRRSSFSSYYADETPPSWTFGTEIRIYIKSAEGGMNMNGLYYGVRGDVGNKNIVIDRRVQYTGYRVTGRVGFQSLLSKFFFVDVSLGLGADYTALDEYTFTSTDEIPTVKVMTKLGWRPIIDPQIKLGWSLSKPRPSETRKDLWLRGQSPKTIQYKIDLFGLFNHNLSGISTALEVEKAIGKSGFSITLGAAGEIHQPNHITGLDQDQFYVEKYYNPSWKVYAEPRWYYNYRKRLRTGLTNSVFSGNFFSLMMAHQQIYYNTDFEHQPYYELSGQSSLTGAELCWGMQRTFFNVAFAECKFGMSYMVDRFIDQNGMASNSSIVASTVADIKVGLKF